MSEPQCARRWPVVLPSHTWLELTVPALHQHRSYEQLAWPSAACAWRAAPCQALRGVLSCPGHWQHACSWPTALIQAGAAAQACVLADSCDRGPPEPLVLQGDRRGIAVQRHHLARPLLHNRLRHVQRQHYLPAVRAAMAVARSPADKGWLGP